MTEKKIKIKARGLLPPKPIKLMAATFHGNLQPIKETNSMLGSSQRGGSHQRTPSGAGRLFDIRPATAGSGIGAPAGTISMLDAEEEPPKKDPRENEMNTTMAAFAASPLK